MGQCVNCNFTTNENLTQVNFQQIIKCFSRYSDTNTIQSRNKNNMDKIRFTEYEKRKLEEDVKNSFIINYNSQFTSRERMSAIREKESLVSISNILFINEQNELPQNKYKIIKVIGKGTYGIVYLAENIFTKEKIAMKKIPKTSEDLLTDNEIMDEIEILKRLDHPDIVKINEFYNTNDNYYIINEYCPGGELYDIITDDLNETEIAVIFKQLFSGLAYLHSNNIIHRDLKLENILIFDMEYSEHKEKLYDIKIIDFGTAKIFDKNKKEIAIVGSSYYIAPEVLSKKYSKECDMWSAGVILYMFITGHPPFDGATDRLVMESVKKGKFPQNDEKWNNSSPQVRDLIKKLLVIEPEKRLTAIDALNHEWFQVTDSNVLYYNISKEDIIFCIKNLLSYDIKSKFEELVWAYIIHNLPRPKEAKNAIKLFKIANKKGDGKLMREELKEALLNFVSEDFLKNFDEIFSLLDADNNGYIDYEEFLRACLDRNKVINENVLKYAFYYFDKEKTGYISQNKIQSYFVNSNLTESDFQEIFKEIDLDKDGKISFKEFKNMMLYKND